MQPKMKLIIGGILGVLIIVIAFFLFRSGDKTGGFSKIVNLEKPSLTNDQIAEKAMGWLDSVKDQQNMYPIGQQCYLNKSCDTALSDKQIGITALWGRYQYYKKTKKSEELQIIREHIKSYLAMSFQPDFWHCRVLYEMSQDGSIFTENEKKDLQTLCMNSTSLRVDKAIEAKKDPNSFNSDNIVNKLNQTSSTVIISDSLPKNEREFLLYGAYVSEFVARHYWFKSPGNLEVAKDYFDNAISYYLQKKKTTISSLPFLGIAALDMYQATNSNEYLKFAKFLTEKIEKENTTDTVKLTGLSTLEDYLFKFTKEKKFKDDSNKNLQALIEKGFDFSGYDGYRIGNSGFHNFGTDALYYSTRNTALIIGLLVANEN